MKPRYRRFGAPALVGLSTLLFAGIAAGEASATSDDTTPDAAVACEITHADVDNEVAMFTVGPAGCTGEVGPISFSSYWLPGGQILPYEDQVLIEHHASNGSMYGEGSYQLTVSLGSAECWQTDLYIGMSDDQPPTPNGLDADAKVGCSTDTVPQDTTPDTTLVGSSGNTLPDTTAVGDTGGELPQTGSNAPLIVASGAALVGLGLMARRIARQPRMQ